MRHLWAVLFSLTAVGAAVSCGSGGTGTSTAGHTGGHGGGNGGNAGNGGSPSSSSTGDGGSLFHPDAGTDGSSCSGAVTCADVGANCGPVGDGCGGILMCGDCTAPDTCGGGGTPSVCGHPPCTPQTCQDLNASCGMQGDGCGGTLDCGTCTAPDTCGGGNTPNQCGHTSSCTPKTCAQLNINCGPAGDGCGNQIDCGTCTGNLTCGGGGMPGVCGAPICTPKTCAQLGATCGPMADGCGGLLDCGTCSAPQTCGGAGMPNQCGIPSTCTNLCLKQVMCPTPGVTTTISGKVYAPNGTDPLPNALVYVPNAAVQPFTAGVSCDNCGAAASGSPLVSAVSGVDGSFKITNAPVGSNIPLVIQIGRWRRQVTVSTVNACVDNPVAATLTRFPKNKTEGDIPLMAFATGEVDALECVMRKIGIADTEFTKPTGTGRIHIYKGDGYPGASAGTNTPAESTLVGSQATLNKYDVVFFPCQGAEFDKTTAQQQNLINYANAGGRVFATHYSYVWLFNDAPFSGTAQWDVDQLNISQDPQTGYINTTFPKGQLLAQWLQIVGASTTSGQIQIGTLREDLDGVIAPAQLWIDIHDPFAGNVPMHYTFNTPVGAPANQQCGRVVYDDFHVEDTDSLGLTFPAECTNGAMTPQEKLLEFMIFDLSSCVTPDIPTCTPKTCAQLGQSCGPAGDGCGNVIQCGTCPMGQTCTGTPSTCQGPMCTPKTCAQQGVQCGPTGDGCGGLLQCGTCPAGQTCGGGGMPGVCGNMMCTPKTCAQQNIHCGPAGDGCGNLLNCGTCPAGQTCGGGGMPGVCGAPMCTPKTCAQLNANCGQIADGCGGLLNCGTCQVPQTCGGGGTPNQCGGSGPH